nr:MAG TPA: hypothetical protein [Caudoviricetes sp.]
MRLNISQFDTKNILLSPQLSPQLSLQLLKSVFFVVFTACYIGVQSRGVYHL